MNNYLFDSTAGNSYEGMDFIISNEMNLIKMELLNFESIINVFNHFKTYKLKLWQVVKNVEIRFDISILWPKNLWLYTLLARYEPLVTPKS